MELNMRLALFEPDIAANVGAAIRLAACFGVSLDIIEPCGFPLTSREIRRVAMDYGDAATVVRHRSWDAFAASPERKDTRVILMTTRAATPLWSHTFATTDIVMMGRESAGVPDSVHQTVDVRLFIPLAPGARSLNVVTAAAITLGEANRQLMDAMRQTGPDLTA